MELHGFTGDDFRLLDGGLDLQAEAVADDAVELSAFVGGDGIERERGEGFAHAEQRGDGRLRFLGVKFLDRLGGEFCDLGATGETLPRDVDAIEEVLRGGCAGEEEELLFVRAAGGAGGEEAEALRLVHAATFVGDGAEGFAGDRIIARDVHREGRAGEAVGAAVAAEAVPDYARGLPDGEALRELLGVGAGIAGEFERLHREHAGRSVVAVAAAAGRDGETRDDHIGPENADDAHDVGEDLLAVPEAQGFVGRF